MATVLKPVRLVNPGKRLTWKQKLHFGTKRQRTAAKARLHIRNGPRTVSSSVKGIYGGGNRKTKKAIKSGNYKKATYYAKSTNRRRRKYESHRLPNVGEIITVRPLAHIMNPAKRRRNIAQGYYDATGFHPIRSSSDYDPDRAGDDYSDTGSRKRRSRSKAKGRKSKSKGRRRNPGIMAKSRKRVLAGKKAARTRARRRYGAKHRRSNPGVSHHRRRTYRRRSAAPVATRRRRRTRRYGNPGITRRRHYRRNPGMLSGGSGIFTQALGVIGGALVTKFGTDAVTSMSPTLATGIPSYIVTAIVATLQGKAIGKILKNPKLGNDMTIGGYVYLALRLMQDFLPAIGNPFSLSGIRGMGMIGPSSFYTPQVNTMNSMGNFVLPSMVGNAIAAGMPVAANGMRGLAGSNTQRRTGRMR